MIDWKGIFGSQKRIMTFILIVIVLVTAFFTINLGPVEEVGDIYDVQSSEVNDVNVADSNKYLAASTIIYAYGFKSDSNIVDPNVLDPNDINAIDEFGYTALDWAVLLGKNDFAVISLIVKGADVNKRTMHGLMPLHHAIFTNNPRIAEILIEHGADVRSEVSDGIMSMHYAARNGCKEIVNLLGSAGVDVNVKDGWGRTPLYYAYKYDREEVVDLLIMNGGSLKGREEVKNENIMRFRTPITVPSVHPSMWDPNEHGNFGHYSSPLK